jgi:hypothetical protein
MQAGHPPRLLPVAVALWLLLLLPPLLLPPLLLPPLLLPPLLQPPLPLHLKLLLPLPLLPK